LEWVNRGAPGGRKRDQAIGNKAVDKHVFIIFMIAQCRRRQVH